MKQHDKLQIAWMNAGIFLRKVVLPLGAVPSKSPLSSPQNYLDAAVAMTNSLKYGVLSTAHPVTSVASRTIQPFEVEFDAQGNPEIYFNTNKFARKVPQLEANQDVTLAYLDQSRMCCVTYTGRCERMPYPESTRHWRDWLWVIFPEGNDESKGSRFTTWRVRPHTINYVNLSEGVVSSRYDGRPPEIVLPSALPPSDPMYRAPSPTTTTTSATTISTTSTTSTATTGTASSTKPPLQWIFREYGDDAKPGTNKAIGSNK
jgi:general stress protein 26